jgi:2-polyprenyl-6-methoxyphenol hydroxylase-like FAD-dependent oxidoreductase
VTGGSVLVIGGGFSGMAAAIELSKRGHSVDLVELDPHWRSYGAGISIGGPALRAFRTLGVLDDVLAQGAASDGGTIHTADGTPIAELPSPRVAGPDVPGAGAIMRPVLAAILAARVRALDVTVRLGLTFSAIDQSDDGVAVTFTDGTTTHYDLVVGADGLNSAVRQALLPDAPQPQYSGQSAWRAVVETPDGIDKLHLWMGPHLKLGINPVSATHSYIFLNEDRPERVRVSDHEALGRLKSLLAVFTDPRVRAFTDALVDDAKVVYRPIESLLVPQPWHRGRVVLIGDAVHATTPHLAAGACIGVEDAIVLAEELAHDRPIEQSLAAFGERRWERCRMVVENSLRLGEIEITGGDHGEHAGIMHESFVALAAEI